jgi:hypothetical protein
LGRDRKARIVIASPHDTSYPCQVALLDNNEKVLRECWHAGHVQCFLATDLGQGWNSFVEAVSTTHAERARSLFWTPDKFTGASTVDDPAYQVKDFPPPVETARLIGPRRWY